MTFLLVLLLCIVRGVPTDYENDNLPASVNEYVRDVALIFETARQRTFDLFQLLKPQPSNVREWSARACALWVLRMTEIRRMSLRLEEVTRQ